MMTHRTRQSVCILFFLLLAGIAGSTEESPKEPDPASLDHFRVIWERSIFNPDHMEAMGDVQAVMMPVAQTPDRIQLIGVLLIGEERTAFFEGNQPAFNALARAGDQVGSFHVDHVFIDKVELSTNGQPFTILVGEGLSGQDGTGWGVTTVQPPSVPEPSAPPPTTTNAPGVAPEPSETPVEKNDLIEKLKARRQQELGL